MGFIVGVIGFIVAIFIAIRFIALWLFILGFALLIITVEFLSNCCPPLIIVLFLAIGYIVYKRSAKIRQIIKSIILFIWNDIILLKSRTDNRKPR